jgi:pSer/pThr/pTyr-binding forkhead associated (FHA) protein
MADPRLNSVHLDVPRRQEYRRARQALLQARGQHTLCAEQQHDDDSDSATVIHQVPGHEHSVAAPVEMDFWLLDRDYIYPLKVGLNTLGRSPDNDVVVQDSFVSRRHCALLVHLGDGCEVHDTASKNGTYVNGHRLSGPTRLHTGDEIRVCDRQFVFHSRTETADFPLQARTISE